MKFEKYMTMVDNLENREYVPNESFEELLEEYNMLWEEIDKSTPKTTSLPLSLALHLTEAQSYSDEQQEIVSTWQKGLDVDFLDMTPFKDRTFLAEFLKDIPQEEQFLYVKNTNNYHAGIKFDPKYAIVTRRAVPSREEKPEQFWSYEHRVVLNGLSHEIPKGSPHRHNSVIMVTTIEKLNEHGKAFNNGGVSDGEITISSKPFSNKNFLFVYKPYEELLQYMSYILSGGIKNAEMLEMLKEASIERKQHYDIEEEHQSKITGDIEKIDGYSDNILLQDTLAEIDDPPKGSGWATMTHGQAMVGSKEQDKNKSRSRSFYESLQSPNDISEESKEAKRRSFRETVQSTNRVEPESREEQIKRSKSFLESLRKSNITSSEVKHVAGEIEEIQRQKALSFKKSASILTPAEELLLETLNKKYGAIEKDNKKKSHDNKNQNGISM